MSFGHCYKNVCSALILMFLAVSVCLAAAPGLIEPQDDARFGDENAIVVLEWEDTGVDDYEFDLAIDSEFEIGTGPLSSNGETFLNINDWLGDDNWFPLSISLYWRVREAPTQGTPGDWSEYRIFHKSTLAPLAITAGEDERYTDTTDMPRMAWENSDTIQNWQLEFASDRDFEFPFGCLELTEPELDFAEIDRTTWDPMEGRFFWRVAPVTDAGVPGPWSDVCSLSKTLLDSPVVIGPEHGHIYSPYSDQAVLSWNSMGTIEEYDIRLFIGDATNGYIPVWTLPPHSGSTTYSFKTDLGIDDESWLYAPFAVSWGIAGYDEDGRPGPFSTPREMIKIGYHLVAGYGDSITEGDEDCYVPSYYGKLHTLLKAAWGNKTPFPKNLGSGGAKSKKGADESISRLKSVCPEYVLIMFGINDLVDPGNCDPPLDCATIPHLAEIATNAQNLGIYPIISTILPVNPDGKFANLQDLIDETNIELVNMCDQMGFHYVDLNGLFRSQPSLSELFCDWGHPNEAGYQVMASGYFDAIMAAST